MTAAGRRPRPGSLSLRGKSAIVTGAAAGIGRATALRFAAAGAEIVAVDSDAEGLARLPDAFGSRRAQCRTMTADLSDRDQVSSLWAGLAAAPPDILVNNAGSYRTHPFPDLDPAALAQALSANLASVIWMCQEFVAHRGRAGGSIVNISSIEALAPIGDELVAYSAAKAGVLAVTRSLAHTYGRAGIRVNALLPGAIRTPGTDRLRRRAIRGLDVDLIRVGVQFQSRLLLGRWGDADEVAAAALFLASDLASYVHGAALPVDGGYLAS